MRINHNKAKSFVTIMVVIAFFALALRFTIEKIIKTNIAQHQSYALSRLKLISAALENYAKDKGGLYPTSLSLLTQSNPPYVDKEDVAQSPKKGYIYSCTRLEASGYSCSAAPLKCRVTGDTAYTISTGSLLISEACDKKD
jgi:hypothetical protein